MQLATCNFTMRGMQQVKSVRRNKRSLFSAFRLDFRDNAKWKIASRFGEEKRRSSRLFYCKSVCEDLFAHGREIRYFFFPRFWGLLKRPNKAKTPIIGAFPQTSAFCPPSAYLNRQSPLRREAGRVCAKRPAELSFPGATTVGIRGTRPCTRSRRRPSCRRARGGSASRRRSPCPAPSAPASPRRAVPCTTAGSGGGG